MRCSRAGAALIAVLSASCPGIDLPDVGPPVDAPFDAHRALDAPSDGGATDAGWVTPGGLPEGCVLERAARPERLPRLSWSACGPGCIRATGHDWPTVADGWFAEGVGWLRMSSSRMFEDRRVTAAGPVDDAFADAWRFARPGTLPSCGIFQIATGEGRAAAVVNFLPGGGADGADLVFVWSAEAHDPTAAPDVTLLPPLVGGFRYTEEVSVSADLVGLRVGAATSAVLHRDVFVPLADGDVRGSGVSVRGDHAVFAEVLEESRLMHWTPIGRTEVYFDPSEQVGEPQLYGDDLVWVLYADFVDGRATRAELWTASLVVDPAGLEPMLVHPDVVPTDAMFADGTFGWLGSPGPEFAIHLVDVPGGRERTIRLGPDVNCTRLLYVSSRDVAVECSAEGARFVYRLDPETVAAEASGG